MIKPLHFSVIGLFFLMEKLWVSLALCRVSASQTWLCIRNKKITNSLQWLKTLHILFLLCRHTACVKMDAYSVNAFPPVTEALVALYF